MSDPEGGADGSPVDLRATGERIEALLDASSSGGIVARERSEELVRLVVELYGSGLERTLEILHETGRLDEVALDALVADDLVASLLLVHGLHPDGLVTRVERALDDVRPYLGSHGGDVELLEVSGSGVVRLRLLGSCDGCASSAATLTLAVEGTIRDAAPEVTDIEVDAATATPDPVPEAAFIPLGSLRVRASGSGGDGVGAWQPAPELAELAAGELRAAVIADVPVVACRVGSERFVFRDRCPSCAASLADARVERRLGGDANDAVLRCVTCGAHYDIRRAGVGIDDDREHLDPVPLVTRHGDVEVALPRSVSA